MASRQRAQRTVAQHILAAGAAGLRRRRERADVALANRRRGSVATAPLKAERLKHNRGISENNGRDEGSGADEKGVCALEGRVCVRERGFVLL